MNQTDRIMALVDDYVEVYADRQALRAAIEQALTPGEPVAYRVWDRMGGISFRRTKPSESEYAEWDALYTAPQPQPKQEPAIIHREIVRIEPDGTETWRETPLYTAPQQREWVGLTNPERAKILAAIPAVPFEGDWHGDLIDAIEAKLREKNGGGRDWSMLEATQDSLREHMAMIHRDTALLRQALEALENHTAIKHPQQRYYRDEAIAALKERLGVQS